MYSYVWVSAKRPQVCYESQSPSPISSSLFSEWVKGRGKHSPPFGPAHSPQCLPHRPIGVTHRVIDEMWHQNGTEKRGREREWGSSSSRRSSRKLADHQLISTFFTFTKTNWGANLGRGNKIAEYQNNKIFTQQSTIKSGPLRKGSSATMPVCCVVWKRERGGNTFDTDASKRRPRQLGWQFQAAERMPIVFRFRCLKMRKSVSEA